MAITEQSTTLRENTKREMIDEILAKASTLAQDNKRAILRLRDMLLGAPPEEQRPERPSRPGWLGELQDIAEIMVENLGETSDVIEILYNQMNSPIPPPTVRAQSSVQRDSVGKRL